MSLHVLVTQGLLPSALAVARSLAGAGHRVTLGDHDPTVIARFSRHVAGFVRLPPPAPDPRRFAGAVAEAARSVTASVVLPLFEEGLVLAAYPLEYGVLPAAMPSFSMGRLLADKGTGVRRAARAGLPVAETICASAGAAWIARELGFPLVVKPRLSTSGAGVRVVRDAGELARLLGSLPAPEDHVAQRWAGSRERVFQGVFDEGRCVAAHAYRVLCKHPPEHGFGILLESVTDVEILSHGVRLGEETGYHGAMGIDFLSGDDGAPRVVEVNPRLVLGVANAVDSGVPIPARAAELGSRRLPSFDARRPGYAAGVRTLHWPSEGVTAVTGEPLGAQLTRWARERASDPGALAAFLAHVAVHRIRGGFDAGALADRSFSSTLARRIEGERALARGQGPEDDSLSPPDDEARRGGGRGALRVA